MDKKTRQTTKSVQTTSSVWSILWLLASVIGVAAAFWITPDRVAEYLSDDGRLSYRLEQKLALLRWAALLGPGFLFFAGSSHMRKRITVLGGLAWLTAAAMFIQTNYPNNLLAHPKRLARAFLGQDLLLKDYQPVAALKVEERLVRKALVPVINIHTHFERTKDVRTPKEMVQIMDETNVRLSTDLDGGVGERLKERIAEYAGAYPNRFVIFASIGMENRMTSWDYFYQVIDGLSQDKAAGARGIKIWKQLGLMWMDQQNRLIQVDDARLDRLWSKAAEIDLPILIHLGDPSPAFEPLNGRNERYEQYTYFSPEWWFGSPSYPRPAEILAQFERVLERHRKTTFIGAHMLCLAHDLGALGELLDRHPNLLVDLSAMPSELGRQPFTARAFFIKYSNRILFGTDGNPSEEAYGEYFRFMETQDEYFDYPKYKRYNAGRWKIYGLNLPYDVLRQVYYNNAAKLLHMPPLEVESEIAQEPVPAETLPSHP